MQWFSAGAEGKDDCHKQALRATYIVPAKCQAKLDIASFWHSWFSGWSVPNIVERATADETCGKAVALELAYERVNDTFVHTLVGFKIQHSVEAARASYYSACNAVDRCAVTGDTREVSASDSLREEQRAEEHSELQAQIAREHREMATRSVEGDLESWSGGSD